MCRLNIIFRISLVCLLSVLSPVSTHAESLRAYVDGNEPSKHLFERKATRAKLSSEKRVVRKLKNPLSHKLTINSSLQQAADEVLHSQKIRYGAIVAIDPSTGRVLAMSERYPGSDRTTSASASNYRLLTKNTFPAASLFKIVTAAAAIESSDLTASSKIRYRGGNYTLNKRNYKPSRKYDRRSMRLDTAMAKSCNPVFGRIALKYLNSESLRAYADFFGFGKKLSRDIPILPSSFEMNDSAYDIARTAAGFGKVFISPIHAASIMGAIANDGVLIEPHRYSFNSRHSPYAFRVVAPETSEVLLDLMDGTVKKGTARKVFRRASKSLKSVKIASKTGTLSGKDPQGRYYWFIASAPLRNPKIAISSLVIDDGGAGINGVGLGRLFLEKFFDRDQSMLRVDLNTKRNS